MIKLIVYCTKAIIALVVAVLFTSCVEINSGIDGSGNVITEKRSIPEPFTKIESNRGIEVVVGQAETVSVEVEADDNLIKHITTKVENGTLIISSDENIDAAQSLKVTVKMPTIEGFEATSGSSIATNATIRGSSIAIAASSGSEIEANLEYEAVTSESSSGSEVTLAGKSLRLNTSSSSGSEIDATGLIANEIKSEASSGSSTSVHPLVSLNAKASSGSSVNYHGAPKSVTVEETSGGDVSKS